MSPNSQYANSPFLFKLLSAIHSRAEVISEIPLSSCCTSLKSPPPSKHSCLALSSQRKQPDLLKASECSVFISFFKCSKILMQSYEILNRKPCGQVRKQPTSFDMVACSRRRYNWLRSKKLPTFVCWLTAVGVSITLLPFTHFPLDHAGWTSESPPSLSSHLQLVLPVRLAFLLQVKVVSYPGCLRGGSVVLTSGYQAWRLKQSTCSRQGP